MRVTRTVIVGLATFALMGGMALAQEGFPLKGSWLGDFGPNKTTRNQVFMTINWDGTTISGMINPGTDNIPIQNATLTPPTPPPPTAGGGRGGGGNRGGGNRGGGGRGGGGRGGDGDTAPPAAAPPPPPPPAPTGPVNPDWLVHFEANGKDRSGNTVRWVVDGKVENIGLANRTIVGTWMVGTTKNDFTLSRQ